MIGLLLEESWKVLFRTFVEKLSQSERLLLRVNQSVLLRSDYWSIAVDDDVRARYG